MRQLFSMDKHDYEPEWKVYSRPSSRGIAVKGDKVLLIYSKRYDYYKFPGGGIEHGETKEEALIREYKEETGFSVIPESIKEFGYVDRRRKDDYEDNAVFEQDNFYYWCDISAEPEQQKLDDYEADEGFTYVWEEPFKAAQHDRYARIDGKKDDMLVRESKVLDLVDLELRKRRRIRHKLDTIKEMGHPEFEEMLNFVETTLSDGSTEYTGAKTDISYSRYEHTERVLSWAYRLYKEAENKSVLRFEDVMIATIFHDVGRLACMKTGGSHAEAGVPITREYLEKKGYDKERINYICMLVGAHSDKHRMKEQNLDRGLLLLMEADLMDDMGALGVIMDCMITEARNHEAHFTDCLDHITRYTYRQQTDENPMVTEAARRFWDEKTALTVKFVEALEQDVVL